MATIGGDCNGAVAEARTDTRMHNHLARCDMEDVVALIGGQGHNANKCACEKTLNVKCATGVIFGICKWRECCPVRYSICPVTWVCYSIVCRSAHRYCHLPTFQEISLQFKLSAYLRDRHTM